MAKSLLQAIEEKLAGLIQGMRQGPYNYQWGKSNERDMAKAVFPCANIYIENENCLDEQNGAWAQQYTNEVLYRIEIRAQLSGEYTNPVQEINKLLYRCLDDLKMLFGSKWNLDGTCDTIMYRGMEIIEEKSGDIYIPSRMVTRWRILYEQSRTEPTQTVQ